MPVTHTTSTSALASNNQLPFTGFDAGMVVLIGLVFVGSGFVVRYRLRRSRR